MLSPGVIFTISALLPWIIVTIYWVASAQKTSDKHKGNELFSFIKLVGSGLIIFLPMALKGAVTTMVFMPTSSTRFAGVLVSTLGVILMIRARECLGKNWSGNVILQQEHSLTKTGPYQYVRHPIYSGGLLAMLGSAITIGYIFSFAWVLFCAIGLIVKSKKEEALLSKQFPAEYSEYKQHSKMLIPFIW